MKGWGTPEQIAIYVGRPARTIRTWAQRGTVPAACDVQTRRLVVHAAATRKHADTVRRLTRAAV
jgi:hypothetical protein